MKNGKKPVRKTIPIAAAKKAEPKPKVKFDCLKCPGYCCSYPVIEVGKRDIARLARHFGIDNEAATKRFTRWEKNEKSAVLRHRKDRIFKSICMFFDQKKRRCTVYEARPTVCRDYPNQNTCGYYDFLTFEREQQDDPKFIALT